jgi:hypothetical protein
MLATDYQCKTRSIKSGAGSLTTQTGYVSMFGRNERGYVEYSSPVQDSELATAMGLVPVEQGLESLCVDQGSRRKESSSDQLIPPHVLSVSSRYAPNLNKSTESKRRRA